MSKADELYEKVVALIAEGETEEAIVFLKKAMKEKPELGFYNDVVLLAGQYNNWEKKRIRGIVTEESEFNRINSELIDLVEKAKRREAEAILAKAKPTPPPPPPPMSASPDPFQVTQNYQASPHPRSGKGKSQAGFNGQIGTYVKGFLIGIGAIFLVFMIAELINPSTEEPFVDPSSTAAFSATQQAFPDQAPGQDELLSLEELLEEAETSGRNTFSPADVQAVNTSSLQQQLGGSVWYDNFTSYIYFNAEGNYATYYNGWGQVFIQSMTNTGAFTGIYQNSYVGDYGTISIQPPGNSTILNITSTSSVNGESGTFGALKQ